MSTRTESLLRKEKRVVTLPTLVNLFVASKEIEGCSQRTVTWYRQTLTKFARYAGNGEPVRLADISLHEAQAFVASLQQADVRYQDHPLRTPEAGHLSASTVHSYVRALKTFSTWLKDESYTSTDLFARLKRPKVPEPVIEILSDEEIERLLAGINPTCFLGARLHLIVLFLLDTGMRATELCTLTTDNTFIADQYVKVYGKGAKERMVPFGTTTKKSLMRYLHTFRPEPIMPDTNELILSVNGTQLQYQGLFHALKRLGKRCGIPRLRPHLFRHTFAVRYLMNGGDIMTLKLLLGHTTLEVTQIYMHLAETHVQIQHRQFSPVDRLKTAR